MKRVNTKKIVDGEKSSRRDNVEDQKGQGRENKIMPELSEKEYGKEECMKERQKTSQRK